MQPWLRFLVTLTFAVFWWREVQYECPLTEDCPRVEHQTMVQDPDVFTDNAACVETAVQRETLMRTQGWNYVAQVARKGEGPPLIKAHGRYRYLCKPLLKR